MKEEGKLIISREEIDFLNQAVGSLDFAEAKLEEAYKKNNPNQFNAVKKFIIKINKRVSDIL
jgi:Fe-S cluster assembly iron-binding protein IscA